MPEPGSNERPLRVAIVGSGPSGFYAADALLKCKSPVQVDMYERLPVPFGLVRFGVAPDHHKIKNVTRVYERIASSSDFNFFGNVTIGQDLTVEELRTHYEAVVFAVGAETDRRLDIPGETLPGSHTATEFVAWYNGHPDHRDKSFDLTADTAVIVGQGNVAIDVARILCKTVEELRATDIADHALEALAQSRIREVILVGRRGPVQAAFTEPEIKEMGELADCDVDVDAAELELNDASRAELDDPGAKRRRSNYEILQAYAARPPAGRSRRLKIRFFRSPIEIRGRDRVESVVLRRNVLKGEPGAQKAEAADETRELACGLLFRSVGYRGVPMLGVPFHEKRGLFPNDKGRITTADGDTVTGLYAVGWIKRGPSGVIGTNRPDSSETIETLMVDAPELPPCAEPDSQGVLDLLAERGVRVVSYADWKRIDEAEIARGKAVGKPREKFTSVEDMLAVLA